MRGLLPRVAENLIIPVPTREENTMSKTAFAAVLLAVPLDAAAQTWKVPAEPALPVRNGARATSAAR
jgi:hypothetical protein